MNITIAMPLAIMDGYRSFVRNVVVQIPKFDAKPNPSPNSNHNPSPNPMPIRFGQMTLWTSELLAYRPIHYTVALGSG